MFSLPLHRRRIFLMEGRVAIVCSVELILQKCYFVVKRCAVLEIGLAFCQTNIKQ